MANHDGSPSKTATRTSVHVAKLRKEHVMETNTFILGAAHSHALQMAMNREGNGVWTNQLVDKMSQKDTMGQIHCLVNDPRVFFAKWFLKRIKSSYTLEELNGATHQCCAADVDRIFYRAFQRVTKMDPTDSFHDSLSPLFLQRASCVC